MYMNYLFSSWRLYSDPNGTAIVKAFFFCQSIFNKTNEFVKYQSHHLTELVASKFTISVI